MQWFFSAAIDHNKGRFCQIRVKRIVVATYQSVSGAGRGAMDELFSQTRAIYVETISNPLMQVADLRALERLPRQVSLVELRANPALRKMKFLKNVRLIISPVSDEEYQDILRMAGIVASPGLPLP